VTTIENGNDGFVVDAEIIAEALGVAALVIQGLMRPNVISSRCAKGVGEDEGVWRLTFFHSNRAFRLTVDNTNQILSRAQFDAPRQRNGTKRQAM
jgi:hypothetical protein